MVFHNQKKSPLRNVHTDDCHQWGKFCDVLVLGVVTLISMFNVLQLWQEFVTVEEIKLGKTVTGDPKI